MRSRRFKYINDFPVFPIVFLFLAGGSGCFSKHPETSEIRFLVEAAPATLNPRQTLDAIGQRIEMLAFRAVTSLDVDLNTLPDLSESWRLEDGGRTVVFRIKPGQVDHRGTPISAERIRQCLENYLFTSPPSPHRSSFTQLKSVTREGDKIFFHLESPDPYLPKNLSVLRYFSTRERPDAPCSDPLPGETVTTNGDYAVAPYPDRFDRKMRFEPTDKAAPPVTIEFIRDETSRLMKLLNGEANFVLNAFSPTKSEWLASDPKNGFRMIERGGINTSYLAFNLRDPTLSNVKVRLAIAHAMNREAIVKYRLRGQGILASGLLNPILPEAIPFREFPFDPVGSETLLDQAGFPRGKDGIRFHIRYKTTTDRLGLELAQVFQDMLGKIGVRLDLDTLEPSVFFASIRKGNFQMYMSRWVGVSDGSIFEKALHSKNKGNLVGYRDSEMDKWIEGVAHETDPKRRQITLSLIQEKMLHDVPYFPLWHWTNAALVKNTLTGMRREDISLSGSFISLKKLRFEKDAATKNQ